MLSMPDDDRIAFKLELTVCDRTIEAETPIPTSPCAWWICLPVCWPSTAPSSAWPPIRPKATARRFPAARVAGPAAARSCPSPRRKRSTSPSWWPTCLRPRQALYPAAIPEALAALGEEFVERLHDTSKCQKLAERRRLGEEYFNRGIPCPFLDQERCSIYQHRPMRCREYLVTSPAENCSNPSPETVRPVDVPVQLSRILFCFADGLGDQSTRWLPLVLALEFSGEQKRFPGPELFRRFVSQIGH